MTYLITGATGQIGRVLVQKILEASCDEKLVLLVRDKPSAEKLFRTYLGERACGLEYIEYSLEAAFPELPARLRNGTIDYMIHCAAPTASKYMISYPVETADSIVLGTKNMLELAKALAVKSMVFLSSMEVYGQVYDIGRPRSEEELGKIDLNSRRSCYSLGKRMAEHYCHIYHQEYGVPVKIARLAQIFGCGVRLDDNRVYMQFAKAAAEKRDIILNTPGASIGNYCASDDAARAILTILVKGENGEVYNVVNEENTMQILDMANLVAKKVMNGQISVKVELKDSKETGYAPDTSLRMSSKKLCSLGWRAEKSLWRMYMDVMDELQL